MGGATLPCYTSSAVTSTRTGQRSIRFHGKYFVPILYRDLAFEPFDDFSDFVKSVSYGTSKTCQVRGSNPCRGATDLGVDSIARQASRIANSFCSRVRIQLGPPRLRGKGPTSTPDRASSGRERPRVGAPRSKLQARRAAQQFGVDGASSRVSLGLSISSMCRTTDQARTLLR
jgi:hypothetical protein